WAALVRADGGVDEAWREAGVRAHGRIDLIRAVPLMTETSHREAMYPLLVATLEDTGASRGAVKTSSANATDAEGGVSGRYVRVTAPGRDRTVLLAEVEILRDGVNVAPQARTSQSSLVSSGAVGGHPEN